VPQVVEVLDGLFVPASDVHTLLRVNQIGFRDIGFRGPPRRTVKILGVFRERLGASEIQEKKESARGERAAHNNARANKQRKCDSNVPRASLRPHPDKPFIGRVKVERADADQGGAERRLVFEAPGNKLRGNDIRQEESDETNDCRRPVEAADVAGVSRLPVSRWLSHRPSSCVLLLSLMGSTRALSLL